MADVAGSRSNGAKNGEDTSGVELQCAEVCFPHPFSLHVLCKTRLFSTPTTYLVQGRLVPGCTLALLSNASGAPMNLFALFTLDTHDIYLNQLVT